MGLKDSIKKIRNSKKSRMTIIAILIVVVLLLLFVWKKATVVLLVILVLLAVAMGLEWFDYDADIGKLWETGSYSESRVESVQDKSGNTIRLIWECVKADVNCANFQSQDEAQALYASCAEEISKNNPDIEDALTLDIYGLDRDKDGIVCEHLPVMGK